MSKGMTIELSPNESFGKRDIKRLMHEYSSQLRELPKYYDAAYKKRKNKKASEAFRHLSKYSSNFTGFFEEAAKANPHLAFMLDLSFLKNGDLRSITAANMITQLFSIYVIENKLQNKNDMQLIIPDALMKKYFADDLEVALEKQYSKEKFKNDANVHPGQIRYPYIQTIISRNRENPEEMSDDMKTFLKHPVNVETVAKELDTVSTFRNRIQEERAPEMKHHRKEKRKNASSS
jgi:hypothetical protein